MMKHYVDGISVCHDLEAASVDVRRQCAIDHMVARDRPLWAVIKFDPQSRWSRELIEPTGDFTDGPLATLWGGELHMQYDWGWPFRVEGYPGSLW